MSYLGTVAQEAGQQLPAQLTQADESKLIEELQARHGRGSSSSTGPLSSCKGVSSQRRHEGSSYLPTFAISDVAYWIVVA